MGLSSAFKKKPRAGNWRPGPVSAAPRTLDPGRRTRYTRGMDDTSLDLASKIARLVMERGWNQEEFARIARLNRHTVRQILVGDGPRRLRNATIGACAHALGVT